MNFFGKRRVYLDYASATPVLPAAADAVARAMKIFANPGGIHADSVAAKQLLENSRERIAAQLACKAREIIFTSGLTEANNIGIVGAACALERARRTLAGTHWIVSSIEHSSVLECFAEVERLGGKVTHVDPLPSGIVSPEKIAAALRPETVFVSVGWGNNEIGTIQPLAATARVIREHDKRTSQTCVHKSDLCKIIFHSDAGQAPLYLSSHVHTLGVDLLSLGSGKLYGPRGIGALYVSNRVTLAPTIFGGGQERGLRSGTEEPALAAGFAAAFDIVVGERTAESQRLQKLRDDFAGKIVAHIPGVIINGSTSLTTGGDLKHVLPHMLNISIPGERSGEYLALQLDHAGISLSTKSACDEGNKSSHVVAALAAASDLPAEASVQAGALAKEGRATNTIRFSLGRATTERDLNRTFDTLAALIRP